ncbi:MAG: nickel-responsive transcriptional regulator NikR [Deltaproteobacteria bacterium]|nr:nickel-responsive transcriptional regulator NikR [Deltaproteobacteria bacterium]
MSDLVRFGIAVDADLLERFDERIGEKGYANRSEAIRDLIRADLLERSDDPQAPATGTLTLVYDHHVRELTDKLTDMQHDLGHHVISTLHVHLDHDHCLEVVVLRGPAGVIEQAAQRIVATKGVIHGRLTLTGVLAPDHAHDPAHHHEHGPHTHTHAHGRSSSSGRRSR